MARSGNKSAFSLLEVLVATAILVVIMALLASLLGAGQNSLIRIDGGARQRQEAMAVLDMISSELRSSMVSPVHFDPFANPGARRPELLINPPVIGTNLLNRGAIFWRTFDSKVTGTTSVVGYFLRWEGTRPLMSRVQLDPDSADAQLNLTNATVGIGTGTGDTNRGWISPTIATNLAPATAENGFQGWLADHVIGFFVRALDPTGKTVTRTSRQVSGIAIGNRQHGFWDLGNPKQRFGLAQGRSPAITNPPVIANTGSFNSLDGYAWDRGSNLNWVKVPTVFDRRYGPALPPMVEIAVVVVTPGALLRLTNTPTYPAASTNFWGDIDEFVAGLPPEVAQSARTYSTTVSIPQSPR